MTSHESGSGGLPGEGNQGWQEPMPETLAELDRLLERCGPPERTEEEKRAQVYLSPSALETFEDDEIKRETYLRVIATLVTPLDQPSGRSAGQGTRAESGERRSLRGELLVTMGIPKFEDHILAHEALYQRLEPLYRAREETADSVTLAGTIIDLCYPDTEHNLITHTHTRFADGSGLHITRCSPVAGPITWQPDVLETLHVEHLHPSGRTFAYVVRSDGVQELFITEKFGRGGEIEAEGLATGKYQATEVGMRRFVEALESSLASGSGQGS